MIKVNNEVYANKVTLEETRKSYIVMIDNERYVIPKSSGSSATGTASNGTNGTDGVSPTISVSSITGGHRLTITDVNGTSTVDVMDGTNGSNGSNGTNGTDGASIWTTTTAPASSNGTYTFTISDLSGNSNNSVKVGDMIFYSYKYYQVASVSTTTCSASSYISIKGSAGTNGTSPTITSSTITGGHRLTITDANGTSTVDVMDGTSGSGGTSDFLSGKNVLFLGDSFIQGYGCHVANSNSNAGTKTYTSMSTVGSSNVAWAKSLYDRHPNATVRNIAMYGATLSQSGDPNMWGELYYLYASVTNYSPDYIILDGGANDAFANATIASGQSGHIDFGTLTSDTSFTSFYFENVSNANNVLEYDWTKTLPSLEAFFSFVQRRYPSAKIIYVEEPEINEASITSTIKAKMAHVKAEVRRACDKWGVTYLKILDRGSRNSIYYGDSTYYSSTDPMHPKQKFYDETIDQIEQAMLGDKQELLSMATNVKGLRFWNVSNAEYQALDDAVKSNTKNVFNIYDMAVNADVSIDTEVTNENNLIDEDTVYDGLSTSSSVKIDDEDTYVLSPGTTLNLYNAAPPASKKLRIKVNVKVSAYDANDWFGNLQVVLSDGTNEEYKSQMLYTTNDSEITETIHVGANVTNVIIQLRASSSQTMYFNKAILTAGVCNQNYKQSARYLTELQKNTWFDKNIVAFGDDIMKGTGNDDKGFLSYLTDYTTNSCGFVNQTQGNTVIAYDANTDANKLIAKMQSYFTWFDADMVIFNGGMLDAWGSTLGSASSGYDAQLDTSTFCGAFEEILRYLRVTKGVYTVFMTTYRLPTAPDLGNYMDKALELCRKWGVPVIDFYYGGQIHAGLGSAVNDKYFQEVTDSSSELYGHGNQTFLNEAGYKFYAPQFESALLNGGYTAGIPS